MTRKSDTSFFCALAMSHAQIFPPLKKFIKKSKFPAPLLAIIRLTAVPVPFLFFGEREAGL